MKTKKLRFSLSTNIMIGLVLGILCGIFFGEYCRFLEIFGDAFIRLLQITILPYITVSLILGIGGLSYDQAKTLAVKAGGLLLLFWALSIFIVLVMPLSFPNVESAAFFSTSMVEPPKKVDFLSLYIPSNPFNSLAENVVPAVVLFCILSGVALIGIKEKTFLLQALSTASEMFIKITNLVVSLTPLGVFAISASAAGTMSVDEFSRLQVYLITFNVAAVFMTFWILPRLLAPLTPFKYKDIIGLSRDALVTAFTTGNLFVVLTVLTENCKMLFKKYDLADEKTDSYVDVIVPVSFNFPNTGKLLMLLFILFAAWFSGNSISIGQYPGFLISGLLSFFGGIDIAMPFMLDLMQLPSDLYQLYVVTGIINSRFATLLAAMNLLVFTILATSALTGTVSVNKRKVANYVIVTLLLTAGVIVSTRFYFSVFLKQEYTKDKALVQMHTMANPLPAKIYKPPLPAPPAHDPQKSRLDEINKRGYIRVGYLKDTLPHAFINTQGQLVGIDVEMAHTLARDLNVSLEFVLLDRGKISQQLNAGYCDIIMTGTPVTTEKLKQMNFSKPYLNETMAFVVRDHRRKEFNNKESVKNIRDLKIGIPDVPYYISKIRKFLPDATIVVLESPREYFKENRNDLDALVFTAETGSAWTLLYPEFSVVIPSGRNLSIP
ncbi:MAG: cation:dicarboxylase symporter family transporter, partial [Desulfobacterales bacterium]|nr:cation:dicarboxylase symporter family transporter [Desulfobacterales bacterium]